MQCQAEFRGAETAQPGPSGLDGSLAEEGPCVKRGVGPRQEERLMCPTMYGKSVRLKRARARVEVRRSVAWEKAGMAAAPGPASGETTR